MKKSKQKELLHELELTQRYVFHGSPVSDIGELEIRQSFDWHDGERRTHGAPSVAATPYADIAIFRALVYQCLTGFGSDSRGRLFFEASPEALNAAKHHVGYVYVLERTHFFPMQGNAFEMDWRAIEPQRPVQIVRVVFGDLPEGIRTLKLFS